MDEQIAVLVEIARVAGPDPAVGADRFRGRVGQVPVTEHVVRRSRDDLADIADGHFLAIGAKDPDLDPRQRLARRAHSRIARGIMILGRQHRNGAGGFGHAIGLNKLRAEHLDALAQQFEGDRRGAIEDIFEAAVIDRGAARVHEQKLQRRGDHEETRHAMLLDRIEHPVGVKFGKNDAGQASGERHDAQPGAADMGARHCHQHRLVIVPFGVRQVEVVRMFAQREQVAVRQHRALGIAGGARGVKLEHRIIGARRDEGGSRGAIDHRSRFGSTDDGRGMVELARQLLVQIFEPRPREHHLRLCVVDDERPFGRRQPPADRRHHDPGARGAVEEDEIKIAVLADPRDPVALLQPRGEQCRRHFRGRFVEFGVGVNAVFLAQRDAVGALAGPMGQEFVECEKLRNVARHGLSLLESHLLRAIGERLAAVGGT